MQNDLINKLFEESIITAEKYIEVTSLRGQEAYKEVRAIAGTELRRRVNLYNEDILKEFLSQIRDYNFDELSKIFGIGPGMAKDLYFALNFKNFKFIGYKPKYTNEQASQLSGISEESISRYRRALEVLNPDSSENIVLRLGSAWEDEEGYVLRLLEDEGKLSLTKIIDFYFIDHGKPKILKSRTKRKDMLTDALNKLEDEGKIYFENGTYSLS